MLTLTKESWRTISISDKADGRTRKISRDKKGHCIMKKASILWEHVTILNMYIYTKQESVQIREAKLIKLQGEMDKHTIIPGNFHTLLHSNWQIHQTENQWGYSWTKQHQPTGSNTSSNNSSARSLPKLTQN